MAKRFGLVAYVLFIISGGCGLVYEVVWARYLGLFLGHTTLAHMCVLAAFMGGLAIGSIMIGRMSGSLSRPLVAYGILEVVVGAYAIAFPTIIGPIQTFALTRSASLEVGGPAWLAMKLFVSVAVMILPTILMGGTFPLLMKHFQPSTTSDEDKSEWLYLVNCVGAVAGSLLAGFVFIPTYGLQYTLLGIGAMNLALGACAISIAFMEPTATVHEVEADETITPNRHPLATPVYTAIAVSGLASMVYELVWIRIFAVTLGSSTYSFTLMLSAFITGISLGSLAVGVIPRLRRNPLVSFAVAEIAIGLVVALTIPMYERLPYIFWRWAGVLSRTPEAYGIFNLIKYSLCFTVMAIPTFFFGMTLPLAIKSIVHRDERIGRDSGFVYGANTAGTLVGALLTGLVLLRFLGIRHSIEFALMINFLAGALLLLASSLANRRIVALGMCVAAIALILIIPKWHPLSLAQGTFRNRQPVPSSWDEYKRDWLNMDTLFYREDDDGTVAVVKSGSPPNLSLFINGKADATSYGDMCTQILVGQIPMLLKPDARDVLVVGLGSGVSANSVLTHPQAHVDCVEISPAVAAAARCFAEFNGHVHQNKRFNLVIEDARTYIAVTPKKYDVVDSEPTNAWIAGVGNLFSTEYYQGVDRVLKPGGIMVQWIQAYETSDDLMRTMIRTVLTVFPYVYVFESLPDYIVVASREPLSPDYSAMKNRMKLSAVKKDMNRISIDSVAAVLGRQILAPNAARIMVGETGDINSDDYPVLEFQAPEAQYLDQQGNVFFNADQRSVGGKDLFVAQYLGGQPPNREDTKSLIRSYADPRVKSVGLAYALVRYYLSRWPDDVSVRRMYASLVQQMDPQSALAAAMSIDGNPSDPLTLEVQSLALANDIIFANSVFTPQDFAPAMALLNKALARDPQNRNLQSMRERITNLMR